MLVMILIKKNRTKLVMTSQGATNMFDITMRWKAHILLARTMAMGIMTNIDQMMGAVNVLLHRHLNAKNVKSLWPMTMVSRVLMTMKLKAVVTAILLGHAIVRMKTMSIANPKSVIIPMSLITAKSVPMIITTTTTTSQVMWSPTNILVMDYTEGDVDVHSHLQTVTKKMTT